jgi:hypothetical protein
MTYTEGWPKIMGGTGNTSVVPLSDAERLREAIETHLSRKVAGDAQGEGPDQYSVDDADRDLWAALDREGELDHIVHTEDDPEGLRLTDPERYYDQEGEGGCNDPNCPTHGPTAALDREGEG